MTTLLQHLQEFNRKERFYLVGMALGNKNFRLSEDFRRTLGQEWGLQIPEDAFAAMDYHLDWLAASLYLTANPEASAPYKRDQLDHRLITATQQDIDFLVAYEAQGTSHVILLEAKGVMAFSNPPFHSKVKRLLDISKAGLWEQAHAKPHFALVSPNRPQWLNIKDIKDCPDWIARPDGNVTWICLPLPETLKKIVTSSQQKDDWKIVPERHGKTPNSKA